MNQLDIGRPAGRYPLKVLFLTSSYPRHEDDSSSVFLRYLAEALADRNVEVHVLAPSEGHASQAIEGRITVHRFQYFPARLQRLAYGSGIIPNLARSRWLWLQVPFFLCSMTRLLVRVLRKERPSLIHAHWIVPQGLIAVWTKQFHRVPLITTAHGADAFALRGRLKNRLKRLVISGSDAWTANSKATAASASTDARLPTPHIIPMGVDVRLFAGGKREKLRGQLGSEEFIVLFVGRLVEKKGCRDLLRGISLLPEDLRHRTALWIVGDGNQKHELELTAMDLGIDAKVRFWGAINNRLLPDFYAAADLFVAPSIESGSGDTEGLGVVLLEAFAGRACVIATRVGGIGSVVSDEVTGLLVEQQNPKALARAITRLLLDAPLRTRLVEAAYLEVSKHYDWDRIGEAFTALYLRVCSMSTVATHINRMN
jgi:glycosyltransferase involved in cell wall biosynthesis